MENIGSKIKYYRQLRGLKQIDLAEKVNKSKSYMSQVENNKEVPNIELLVKIADVLKVNVSDLFEKKYEVEDGADKWVVFGRKVEEEGFSIEQLDEILKIARKLNPDK